MVLDVCQNIVYSVFSPACVGCWHVVLAVVAVTASADTHDWHSLAAIAALFSDLCCLTRSLPRRPSVVEILRAFGSCPANVNVFGQLHLSIAVCSHAESTTYSAVVLLFALVLLGLCINYLWIRFSISPSKVCYTVVRATLHFLCFVILLHCESKKQDTLLMSIISRKVDRFSTLFHS